MNFAQRILDAIVPKTQGSKQLATAVVDVRESTEQLRRKLDEDPCASDPTRAQCRDEVARAIRLSRARRG